MKKVVIFATIVAIALGSAIFISCQKENEPTEKASAMNPDQAKAQALMQKINDFASLRAAYQSGAKSDETMTLAEAREILDLTINFEHSEHMTPCDATTLDTLHIAMPAVDKNGMVAASDVIATYAEFETSLSNRAAAVEDGMDVFSFFSIMLPETESKDNEIEIIYSRGTPSPDPDSLVVAPEPFGENDNWYWGYLLGRCDGNNPSAERRSDAANELSKKFKFHITPPTEGLIQVIGNVEYGNYCAYSNITIDSINIEYFNGYSHCDMPWLFYLCGEYDEEPCIPYEDMNCYWRNIRTNIVFSNAPLHYSRVYHSPYYECTIIPKQPYGPYNDNLDVDRRAVRLHYASVKYCIWFWFDPNHADY